MQPAGLLTAPTVSAGSLAWLSGLPLRLRTPSAAHYAPPPSRTARIGPSKSAGGLRPGGRSARRWLQAAALESAAGATSQGLSQADRRSNSGRRGDDDTSPESLAAAAVFAEALEVAAPPRPHQLETATSASGSAANGGEASAQRPAGERGPGGPGPQKRTPGSRRGPPDTSGLGDCGGLEVGQRVVGTVTWANEAGAKISVEGLPNVTGYMPWREGPLATQSPTEAIQAPRKQPTGACLPRGLVREFEVVKVGNGRGPLLSARSLDWDLLWRRAVQMHQASHLSRENLSVTVVDANAAGVVAHCEGLPRVFVPVSQLQRPSDEAWWSEEELRNEFTGKTLEVAINDVEPPRKVVASMVLAKQNRAVRQIKVGALVWGTVRRVEAFGVFVGIDEANISGLVHISNISRAHVRRVQDCFAPGDRILSLVLGMDPGYVNISLSTAELEAEDGDILRDPQSVYRHAHEQQAHFLEHLQALQAAEAAGEELGPAVVFGRA